MYVELLIIWDGARKRAHTTCITPDLCLRPHMIAVLDADRI